MLITLGLVGRTGVKFAPFGIASALALIDSSAVGLGDSSAVGLGASTAAVAEESFRLIFG